MFDFPSRNREPNAPDPIDLGLVLSAWSPVVSRDRRPNGFRLTLRRQQDSAVPAGAAPRLADLLNGMLDGFTADGSGTFPRGLVILAPQDMPLDETLLRWKAPRNVLLEVSQRELADETRLALLVDVQRQGVRLALHVDNAAALRRDRLALFQYVIGGAGIAAKGGPSLLALGFDSVERIEAAFAAGAHAIIGWPLNETAGNASGMLQPTQRAVLELIRLVQADADVGDLERAFKGEPILAYLLLTLANSPAFIRSAPVASLSQAIGLLGYKRLLKWLVLLLVIASKEGRALPHIYASVARGFLIENMATALRAPPQQRDELFVTGAFSLLDKIIGRPFGDLAADVQLPGAVMSAVIEQVGPYAPYLVLARATETGDAETLRRAARYLHLPIGSVNAALLHALAATDALQTVV
jgi:EAL and modified HD-GYP domain-containing signal transduction protein